MADELGDQQDYIEYLELRRVWKSIGLTLTNDVLQEWRTKYPVNIAVLDSGVKEDIQAFQSKSDLPKVLNSKSFVAAENDTTDVLGHGTFCAGVAAGYPIPSPKKVKDYKVQKLAEIFSNLQQLPDGSRKAVEDIFDVLSGGDLEDFPFVGVAPFANIISYKVIDDNDMLNEEALACALQDLVQHNSRVEFKEKIHIVSMSLSAHYHDGVRRALYDVLNNDMIIVAAACNMGQKNNYCSGNIWFPARFGNVISVGSHDNHGQPSKISSVGREVDFLAPGEEIWGPSISKENEEPSTSAEKEYSSFIEKDEGTSVSAAIVSGIVALVLAFVHKEKGADVRAKISNNPVMKEILGNMATKRGQHDKIEGYGSLKPLKVFGYGGHILWSLIENLPGITENCNINGNVRVSNFMLSESALAMHFLQERERKNKYIFHNKLVSSIQSVLDALDHLNKRQFASHVDVIDLRMPPLLPNNGLDQVSKLLLCKNVLPIIENSEIKVIEQLFFPSSQFIIVDDFCMFMNKLSKSVLSGLKIVVMPVNTYVDVLYRVAQILSTARLPDVQEPVYIFVSYPVCTWDFETPDSDMSERVKIISTCPYEMELGSSARRYPWMNLVPFEVYFQHLVQMSRNAMMNSSGYSKASDQLLSVDDLALLSIELKSIPPTPRFITAYKCTSVPALAKVTVAILGDAINIHQKEIYHKIDQVTCSNLKSFTIPSGGIVEKGRHLGTLCASIIAGKSEGIAPFVDLVYATVMNAEAKTKPEWVISALKWIEREHSDVDIVLIPLGFDKFNLGLFKIINRLSKNMVIVCAANNSREAFKPGICFPARYGDVICVGSHSTSSLPSSFSPQGREIDLLALGEAFTFQNYSVGDASERTRALSYTLTMIHKAYVVSGTCVAAACAAGVIAQIVAFALHCGFERQEITNNTVVRELLKHLTCNFSHDPHSGHGWVKNLSESELFKSPEYFKKIVEEILSIDDGIW